ncbi:MAG: hypothetical protein WBB67_14785 [bacterium]
MVIVIGFGQATKSAWPLEAETEHEMYIEGKSPKVGEVFEVVYRVRLKVNIPPEFGKRNFFVKFGTGTYGPAEVIGIDEICIPFLVPGEWQEVRGKYRIPKPYKMVFINTFLGTAKGHKYRMVGGCLRLFLIDSLTGQYGTGEEYEKSLSVVHRYDPVDGSFTCSPSQNPAPVEENRRIIKMIKALEPRLSDSLALLLHSDQYRVGIPKGLPKWHEENKRWLEEEIFEYYLKDGWFEALRENRREEWLQEEKKKIESRRKEGRINFFRPDNNSNSGGANPPSDRINKDFYGQWWFKDHNYNKDQGLLATAVKRPIKNGKARLLMTYMYSSNYYRVLSNYDATDDSGYFHIIFDIPQGATGCKAYPVIYPSGPYPNVPMVMLSDPNIAQPDYWKDIDDPTFFIMRELGVPTYHDFYANAIPCSLGVIWTDTFPQSAQPQSGCINIYETYLHARIITPEEPYWQLRVMWEPGYDTTTKYKSTDTIFVCGNTTSNDDEWNDDILLHEFGHYLMHHYAQLHPTSTSPHAWWNSYPDDTCLAYQEGWAHFFSGRARTGTETDSLIVDTDQGIGSTRAGYLNLENPWDYSANWNPVDSFEGGPWCEGAVAGALWDIYDSHDEIPYPSYPDSLNGVWFPDTALADSLTMGPEEIWTVFDD